MTISCAGSVTLELLLRVSECKIINLDKQIQGDKQMTPKEIVLSGYEAFAEGNMAKLGAIYHPECRININGKHALSGEYVGFDAFASEVLAKLETTWPGFNLDITKVVAEGVDVCIFLKVTANNLESYSIHHFVVEDGLETEFNIYDDSQRMAEAMMSI